MRTQSRSDAALLAAVLTASLLAAAVPVALGADRSSEPASGGETTSIDARAHRATLELYALETRLERARSTLTAIASRRAIVERERASVDRRLAVARAALQISEDRRAGLLRALYQSGGTDPLELVLGADSIDEAMRGLEGLHRAAAQTASIVGQARTSRLRLRTAQVRLARRAAELRELSASARAEAAELASAVAARSAYVAELRRRQQLNATRIAAVQADASAAVARTVAAKPAPPTDDAPAAPVRTAVPGATLTVTSTGYAIRGHTSTGVPTGPGVAAVDPSVIPLGTRFSVPGYGEAVAADTGSAVSGNTIDLWFPTLEEAHAWGRRTVTITLR